MLAYDFTIKEQDFQHWAQKMGWDLTVVNETPGLAVRTLPFESDDQVFVSKGYRHFWQDPERRDSSLSVYYDRDRGRAYFRRSYR